MGSEFDVSEMKLKQQEMVREIEEYFSEKNEFDLLTRKSMVLSTEISKVRSDMYIKQCRNIGHRSKILKLEKLVKENEVKVKKAEAGEMGKKEKQKKKKKMKGEEMEYHSKMNDLKERVWGMQATISVLNCRCDEANCLIDMMPVKETSVEKGAKGSKGKMIVGLTAYIFGMAAAAYLRRVRRS